MSSFAGTMLLPALTLLASGRIPDGAGGGGPPPVPAAEIVAFEPPSGVLAPGDTATSSLAVRNAGRSRYTFWVGYSVQDAAGRWHDVLPSPLPLDARQTLPVGLDWIVPADSPPAGEYRVVMAIWDRPPGTQGALRLAGVDRPSAFEVATRAVALRLAGEWWSPTGHPLGRGQIDPAHVLPGSPLRLRLPAGSCDGAEIRTDRWFGWGEYAIRMRTPHAPGALTAFFLYQDVRGGNDEIDVEIYNDGSRRALLSVWVAGTMTQHAEVVLPFDPADGFHEYAIRRAPGSVQFHADGQLLREWSSQLPTQPMRVFVNAWWPVWLPCAEPAHDRELLVDQGWVRELATAIHP